MYFHGNSIATLVNCVMTGNSAPNGGGIYCMNSSPSMTNCTFYSKGSHWDCRETIDEPVREKNRSNFCGFFKFKTGRAGDPQTGAGQNARKAFDSLFGD